LASPDGLDQQRNDLLVQRRRKDAIFKLLGLIPRDRSQIRAWPVEAIHLIGDDPRSIAIKPQAPLRFLRDFDAKIGIRWTMRDRNDRRHCLPVPILY